MSWTDNVRCANPICSITAWRVVKGVWTCQCGAMMSPTEIKKAQKAEDIERWLAAEREWREGQL